MAQPIVTRARCRFQVDAANRKGNFVDALTGQVPTMWDGNVQQWEIGLFLGLANGQVTSDTQVIDLTGSGLESLTVEVKATASTSAPNLMAKTVSSFDNTLLSATWLDGSKQHALIQFSDEEANIGAGNYWLVVSGITSAGPFTYGGTQLTVIEDGTPGDTDDPQTNPGSAISLAQADARYVLLSADAPASKRGCQALTNGAGLQAVAFTTPFATAPSVVLYSIRIPSGGVFFEMRLDDSTVADTGFTLKCPDGLTIPAAGYKADWQAFL